MNDRPRPPSAEHRGPENTHGNGLLAEEGGRNTQGTGGVPDKEGGGNTQGTGNVLAKKVAETYKAQTLS